jgi:large subunit ribosomal protein L9
MNEALIMKVILLDKINKLGNLGDQVNVKSGFGRNYLLPFGKAITATESNVKAFEERRTELELAASNSLTQAQGRASQLEALGELTITANASDEGKLFGSIGTREIAETINKENITLNKSEIRLPEGALRNLGQYSIPIQVHHDISVDLIINIIPQ